MSLLNSYSKEQLAKIAKNSTSWRNFSQNLGYNSNSGDLYLALKAKTKELNIDTSHFKSVSANAIKRNEENIFIENSTADQKTLRKWFLKKQDIEYKCSICGQEPIWQNKPLTLILDHINGVNNDDRLENLRWVCPNCNIQLPTTGSRNRKNVREHFYCIDCGKEVSKNSTRCMACAAKYRIIPEEEMPVSREELKVLIRTKPFTQIGKQFGVSDNAVRKWCDKYGLPRKVNDIKQYSDEEWLKM